MLNEEVKDDRAEKTGCTSLLENRFDSAEVSRRYIAAVRSMQRSEVEAAFYLVEVEQRRIWFELGYSSVIHYATETGGISTGKAYGLLRIGKKIKDYPILLKAYLEGRLPWTKAREILRLKGGFDESEILAKADTLGSRELESIVTSRNSDYRAEKKERLYEAMNARFG